MFDFGPLAAQDDTELLNYFHITEQVKKVIINKENDKKFIYVSKPGGGKTALVKGLINGVSKRRIIPILSEQIRLYIEDDDSLNIEDYKILFTTGLFFGLISESKKFEEISSDLKKTITKFNNSFIDKVKDFFGQRFEGISILGNGFSLKAENRRDYLTKIRSEGTIKEAEQILRSMAHETNILIVVDNPESIVGKGLNSVTEENAKRVGAFLSVLSQLSLLGIQAIVFLKEHILQSVTEYYDDFSHFEDRIDGLAWTEDDLIELIKLRLNTRINKPWEEVFKISELVFRKEIIPNLINGPRDLLFLCNTAGEENKLITRAMLRSSIDSLRQRKWVEIRKQYYSQWPKIDSFSQTLISLLIKEFNSNAFEIPEFKRVFEDDFEDPDRPLGKLRQVVEWIDLAKWGLPPVHERLFSIGCLGYMDGNKKIYSWAGGSLEKFKMAKKLFVNPLFVNK